MNDRIYQAKPVFLNGTNKWYIEVDTRDFGRVLLLDKAYSGLPIAVSFDTEIEAIKHMEEWEKGLQHGRNH